MRNSLLINSLQAFFYTAHALRNPLGIKFLRSDALLMVQRVREVLPCLVLLGVALPEKFECVDFLWSGEHRQ